MDKTELYKIYAANFERMKKQYTKPLMVETVLSKRQFNAMYLAKKEELTAMFGREATEREIIHEVVEQHKGHATTREKRALQKAMAKLGSPISFEEASKWAGVPVEEIENPVVRAFFEKQEEEIARFKLAHPNATSTELRNYITATVWSPD